MDNKQTNLKEKLKQALESTVRVISDDLDIKKKTDENKDSNKFNFIELDNIKTKNDFIKARAETDSTALKKKFSNDSIYKKNLPNNSSCKSLYSIAEKIRYESLGGRMLKGVKKNIEENYIQTINLKRKDQLKSKEDVPVAEAFELYMLKKFHGLNLNSLTSKMLNFWEKDFDKSINKHIEFLKKNMENQNNYGSRFSEIFQEMNIFSNEDNEENMISGSATEFSQVVTQVRNINDTSLKVSGKIANEWMSIAQCFAGPPENPPEKGTRFTRKN